MTEAQELMLAVCFGSFLDEQTEAVTEYSEPLARRLIEKITVYDEKLAVEFKSGLTVEVEA